MNLSLLIQETLISSLSVIKVQAYFELTFSLALDVLNQMRCPLHCQQLFILLAQLILFLCYLEFFVFFIQIRTKIVDMLNTFRYTDLPIVVNFLLESVTSQESLEVSFSQATGITICTTSEERRQFSINLLNSVNSIGSLCPP